MKFNQVVKRFEKIAATRDHKQKVELVGRFFKSIFSLQQQFRDNEGPNAVRVYIRDLFKTVYNQFYLYVKQLCNCAGVQF